METLFYDERLLPYDRLSTQVIFFKPKALAISELEPAPVQVALI